MVSRKLLCSLVLLGMVASVISGGGLGDHDGPLKSLHHLVDLHHKDHHMDLLGHGGHDIGHHGGPDVGHHGGHDIGHHGGPDVGHHGGPDVGHHGGHDIVHHGGPEVGHHGGHDIGHLGGHVVRHHGGYHPGHHEKKWKMKDLCKDQKYYAPDPHNCAGYLQKTEGGGVYKMKCAPATHWSQLACTCVHGYCKRPKYHK